MNPWIVPLAASLVLATSSAPSGDLRLTLDDAVRMALKNDEALQIERESSNAAAAAVTVGRGAYDQVLSLQGSWEKSRQPLSSFLPGAVPSALVPETGSSGMSLALTQLLPTGGMLSLHAQGARATSIGSFTLLSPSYGTQVGLEFRHPLLRDLSIDPSRLAVRTALADERRAHGSLQRVTAETVAGTERAYWALIAARLDVNVEEEAVRLAEEQLHETEIRASTGAASRTELAQPEAELERRRGELLGAREAATRAENALKLMILSDRDAGPWATAIVPGESLQVERESVDVAAALERALARRPELEEANAVLTRRRVESRSAADAARPRLDAVVRYDRYGLAGSSDAAGLSPFDGRFGESFTSLRDGDFHAASVGVVLELPLRNQEAEGARAGAQSLERQAQAGSAWARKTVRAEVLDVAAALETAGQRIDAAQAARRAAEVQLAAEKDRYATGLSTNFLVLTRQNDLSRARLDEISALTDYRMARTEMARATGTLTTERGIEVQEPKRQENAR